MYFVFSVSYFTTLSVATLYSIEWQSNRYVMNYTGRGRKLSVLIEALSQRLPGGSEENYEKTFPVPDKNPVPPNAFEDH